MKKYIISGFVLIIVLIVIFGIKNNEVDYPQIQEVLNKELQEDTLLLEQTDMNLYLVDDNYELSLYEPKNGCYIGAYVLGNKSLDYNMMEFEKVVNRKHGIYIYNLTLGNPLPTTWILECIASMKTPLIVIHPNDDMILNENLLYDTAKSFEELSVPMFIEFYPNPEKYNIFPKEYKEFYSKANEIFKSYSSNSAFIWSVNINNVYNSRIYYPDNNVVDWIGLSIYDNAGKSDFNIWSGIDFFYNEYQKLKPIMITQFAVSHYSDTDHTYYINQAENKINDFYTKIRNEYPRIKGINYMDFNINESYKVTEDKNILEAYKSAIDNEYFKYDVDMNITGYNKELFKSAFDTSKKGNDLYISDKALKYELNIDTNKYKDYSIEYKNTNWYNIGILKEFNIQIIDKNIYIEPLY